VTTWTNALFALLLLVQKHPDVAHLKFQVPRSSEYDLSGDAVHVETNATKLATEEEQLAAEHQEPVTSSTRMWVVKDGRILDQQEVWMRLVGVMFVMTIAVWYAYRAFLGRRKRLAKAAGGRRESR
jgi:hypothetical protein